MEPNILGNFHYSNFHKGSFEDLPYFPLPLLFWPLLSCSCFLFVVVCCGVKRLSRLTGQEKVAPQPCGMKPTLHKSLISWILSISCSLLNIFLSTNHCRYSKISFDSCMKRPFPFEPTIFLLS